MNEIPKAFAAAERPQEREKEQDSGRIGVLLINLGTPDATSYWAMRRYLKEFLSDRRVIETAVRPSRDRMPSDKGQARPARRRDDAAFGRSDVGDHAAHALAIGFFEQIDDVRHRRGQDDQVHVFQAIDRRPVLIDGAAPARRARDG